MVNCNVARENYSINVNINSISSDKPPFKVRKEPNITKFLKTITTPIKQKDLGNINIEELTTQLNEIANIIKQYNEAISKYGKYTDTNTINVLKKVCKGF